MENTSLKLRCGIPGISPSYGHSHSWGLSMAYCSNKPIYNQRIYPDNIHHISSPCKGKAYANPPSDIAGNFDKSVRRRRHNYWVPDGFLLLRILLPFEASASSFLLPFEASASFYDFCDGLRAWLLRGSDVMVGL